MIYNQSERNDFKWNINWKIKEKILQWNRTRDIQRLWVVFFETLHCSKDCKLIQDVGWCSKSDNIKLINTGSKNHTSNKSTTSLI